MNMNQFFVDFFIALTWGFYALCGLALVGVPISFIIAFLVKTPSERSKFAGLAGKLFLLFLLFFAVGFGSCVMVWELDPPNFH